jgi:hypothetical protein
MNSIIYSILFMLVPGMILAQDDKIYTTTSGELIFSFASINDAGDEDGSIMRFSPVINIQNWLNYDKSEKLGFFTGLSVRNVGFIYDVDETTRKKYRTYNVGIPVGVKIGNLSDKFVFFGYELEIPVNYKEKTFIDEDKDDKKNIWFTDRVPTVNHSLMAGIQLPYGATIKFKYYLTNFFDEDFTASDGQGGTYKPYENLDVNIFYFSLSFGLLKNTSFYYNED